MPHPEESHQAIVGLEQTRECLLAEISEARQRLLLYLPRLGGSLTDDQRCLTAISRFARGHRDCRVHILVHDIAPAVRDGHRLIGLLQHIPSKVQCRRVPEELQDSDESYIVADERRLLLLPQTDRYEGRYYGSESHDGPRLSRKYQKAFMALWDQSPAEGLIRVLSI